MIYYKVNEKSAQVRSDIRVKQGFLIANELFTERVIKSALMNGKTNQMFIDTHFTKVELKPVNTYWFFGARFETSIDYSKSKTK